MAAQWEWYSQTVWHLFGNTIPILGLDLTGWFQVAWSGDIGTEQVIPMRYFGRDLVAYRGRDGVVRVHDRHCRHLGASLAHGGCVVDDGIQCPFHGWVWTPDGHNVSIPYQDRPNRAPPTGHLAGVRTQRVRLRVV